jgi:hypothetical protein
MSPLQQVRLNRRSLTLTPRSHALYAFGESPARVRRSPSLIADCREV